MTATLDRRSKARSVSPPKIDQANSDEANSDKRSESDPIPSGSPARPARLLAYCRSAGISAVIALFVVVSVGDAIPSSRLADAVDSRLEPVLNTTGFYQRWALFSPEPLMIEVRTFAIVAFEDGSETIWFPTDHTNNIDSSTNERWRKWEGRLREDSNSAHWPATAQFVARHHSTGDVAVSSVRLVRAWSDVPPPDASPNDRTHYEFHFFEWDATTETGWMLGEEDQIDAVTS